MRDISHKLGEARDLDVYIARSALSKTVKNVDLHPRAMERAGRARSERDRAHGRVMSTLHSKRFRLLMDNLSVWIERGPRCSMKEHKGRSACDQPILDFVARVLELRWRRLKHRSRHFDRLSPGEHPRIRIKAKKMRYASEFLSSLMADPKHRSRHKMFIAALESLQTCLGNETMFRQSMRSRPSWHAPVMRQRLGNAILCALRQVLAAQRRSVWQRCSA
ncbi:MULTISPECIES: CHAD domain-containing protein [unclassified Tardiphaga]|uniref:CHAD domain-containing protein n=1 Tax=unclassified Tardiphaga TaxID=2631404 RepID=UPI0034A03201